MMEALTEPLLGPVAGGPAPRADSARLRDAVMRHFRGVWCFLRRLGLEAADADDAAQDVMIVTAEKLGAIEPGRERSFMFGTAYRTAMKYRESSARTVADEERLLDVIDSSPGPEALSEQWRARQLLDWILGGLPIELRAVFVLAQIEELAGTDIAALLELPAGTVASRLRRARELFDARLARVVAGWSPRGGVR